MIRFRLLGGLDLRNADDRELRPVLSQPKRLALLAYLVAARPAGFHRRDTLLALFWPELDSARARDALNQSLRYLREVIGSETIVSRGADVGVDTTRIWCDATAFRELCATGSHSEALDLYQGDFLTGFFVADSAPELDQWLEKERHELRARASSAALALAERAVADGNSSRAGELARRAMALEAESEASLRRAVVILDRAGDRAAALTLYDEFAHCLARELEAEPAPETRRLIEDIRARRSVHTSASPNAQQGEVATAHAPVEADRENAVSVPIRPRRRVFIVPLIAIACLTATAAAIYSSRGDPPDALRENVIVVAPVNVMAPDLGLWREGIVDVLSRSLDGAGEFRTVAPGVALRTAGIHSRVAPEDLARRTAARFVLIGTLQRTGNDSARLSVTVRDVARQVTRGEVVQREAVERMDYLADAVAVDVIELLLGSTTSRSPQLRRVGTRSLPALKAFLQGRAFHRQRQFDSAETHFSRAIALDSSFALAYNGLADAASQQANGSFVREAPFYAYQAARFNRGLGTRDSAVIVFDSVYLAAYSNPQSLPRDQDQWGHIRRAMRMSEQLVADDPLDPDLWVRYAEVRYHLGGAATRTREREVMDAFDRAIALDSSLGLAYSHTPGLGLQVGGWTSLKRHGASAARYGIGNSAADMQVLNELERAASQPSRARRIVDSLPVAELSANIQAVAVADSDGTLLPAAIERIRGSIRDGKLSTSEVEFNDRMVRLLLKFGRYGQVTGVLVDEEKQPISFLTAALVGAIPENKAAPVFTKWLGMSPSPAECLRLLEWWAQRGDLTSIQRCTARRISEFQADSVATVRRMAEPARVLGDAYAAVARRDTMHAVRTLSAFPDSLCAVWCWFTLEPRVRLLAAAGRHRDAFELARYRSHIDFASSGLTVPMALARARLAARLGDPSAVDEYRVVAELWARADPQFQPIVAEARAALR